MTTNFFEAIANLTDKGNWTIIIAKEQQDILIVSALFNHKHCGDEAMKLIPPVNFKGTPQDIDKAFFETIASPIQTTSRLLTNMEQYLKAQEATKTQSAMEKGVKDKEQKEKDEKKKKYDAAMKKVGELEEAKKYAEAIASMPKAAEYAEHADTINKRLDALWKKHGQLSLL